MQNLSHTQQILVQYKKFRKKLINLNSKLFYDKNCVNFRCYQNIFQKETKKFKKKSH